MKEMPWIGDMNRLAEMKIQSSFSLSEIQGPQSLRLKKQKRFVSDALLKMPAWLGQSNLAKTLEYGADFQKTNAAL
jgi:hypothetical protein